MVDGAGGRSQISQLTAGLIVVVVLLFLTVPLSYMPNAVLASVVFLIGVALIDVQGMRKIASAAAGRVRGGRDHRGRRRDRRRRAGDHPGDAALDHRARRPLIPSARPAAVRIDQSGNVANDADRVGDPGRPGARDLPLRQRHLLRQREPVHRRDPRARRCRLAQAAVARRLDGVGGRHRLLGIRHGQQARGRAPAQRRDARPVRRGQRRPGTAQGV